MHQNELFSEILEISDGRILTRALGLVLEHCLSFLKMQCVTITITNGQCLSVIESEKVLRVFGK